MAVRWTIETSTAAPGAIGIIALRGPAEELEPALERAAGARVSVGAMSLRDVCGVDRGVVVRWSPELSHLMPHGGIAVMRQIAAALVAMGIPEGVPGDPRAVYPEAASLLEARMLDSLARAASPLALDLLLEQPARWPAELHDNETPPPLPGGEAPDSMRRLIDPPLVVAIGPPNVGKSSLVNALAGRAVSIVADEPGTTRDHVGVMIDLAGLVVRYIDAPGIRADGGAIEQEAIRLAMQAASGADLVLSCGDAAAAPVAGPAGVPHLRVATRIDLGDPGWAADARTSVRTGEGMRELVALIRDTLVPPAALSDPRPWRFWAV